MTYYFKYADKITRKISEYTESEKMRDIDGLVNETEIEPVLGYDGCIYESGYAPEKPQIEIDKERITELKQLLSDTDYISCKIAEGSATKEEYAEQIAHRQAWRDEINSLEGNK